MFLKKVLTVLVTALVISVVIAVSLGFTVFAENDGYGYQESAPESHDGISNGSGTDGRVGSGIGIGPAPNSGDGYPDGSGF
jgi:hypothetical protein